MLKRTHVRHFIALVETGGFTAAARRLNLTQPTLSASIAELERQVGTPIILRERRTIRLTPAGQRLLTLARTIEREFRAAEAGLGAGDPAARPLVLGVIPSLPTRMIVMLRRAYRGDRPLVLREGGDAELRRRMDDEQVDAAITILHPGEASASHFEEGYGVLMAADHPLAGRDELQASDLAGETMIARRSCELLGETSKFFTLRGVRPQFLFRSANEDRCLALVRAGFAITTGPASLAGEGIVAVPLADYAYRRSVGLIASRRIIDPMLETACGIAMAAE